MDVEMPDGTIIEDVPDGITKAQLMGRYSKFSTPEPAKPIDPGIYSPGAGDYDTGQPRPLTPDEWKTTAGVVGSTAGALLLPELAIPAALSKVPAVGGALSFIGRNIPKIFGAGVGGAGGETAADVAQGNEIDPAQMGETAAEYGASELAGSGIGKLAEKALAPVANAITPQIKKLLEFTKKEKIPISAGALVPGMIEKIIKGGTDNFIPSRLVNHYYRSKLVTRMNELMSEIPEGVGQVLGKEESSIITTEAFRAASNSKLAKAKRLRTEFLDTVGPATVVPVKNTEALLKKISPQVKDPALREFIEVELASITKGAKSAEQLEQTLNQIGSIRAKGADKKYLTEIREAAQKDFAGVGADMEKLSHSSNFFKMNSELLSSRAAKRIMKENLTSSQLTAEIFRSGNEGFIKQLSKEMPKETWDSLRAQNLANQFENFSTLSDKAPGVRIIDGDRLFKWIENNRASLDAAYDKETIEAFENLAALSKAAKSDISEFNKGAIDLGSLAGTGTFGGLKYSEPVTVAVGGGGLMVIANEMMRPNGIIKQWLTTGIKGGKEIGEVSKLGGRALVSGEDDGSN